MSQIHDLRTLGDADRSRIGAKAANLGRMLRAGLPVPDGFCVEDSLPATAQAIATAYEVLGGGRVAVRSSAVGEDETAAAFAGVFRSRLGVRGWDELTSAIEDVRRSAAAEYLSAYQPRGRPLRMTVIVQRLIEADAAGVLFTRDPLDEAGRSMSVSATWGMGERVVGGTVTPDRFRVERDGGRVVTQTIARKPTRQTVRGIEGVPDDEANAPCLTAEQLGELARLALSVEQLFGEPCDIEWAFAGGQFWLVQARPIATAPSLLLARLREREIQSLRAKADPYGTVWARYQLAESASRPTPITWGVLQSLLSVRGGYGRMLRALGFDPDPRVDDEGGFVELIAGQPYLNLNREARLDFRDIPYGLDFDRLRRDPAQALRPQRELTWGRTTPRFWARLPSILWRAWRQSRRLRKLEATYADDLRRHCREFAEAVDRARTVDFAGLSDEALLDHFDEWRRRTLEEFAEVALQPGIFAALLFPSVPGELTATLAAAPCDIKTDQAAALHALLSGELEMQTFLRDFGHRGPEELELAQPRWRESPPAAQQLRRASGREADVEARPCRPYGPTLDGPTERYCSAVSLRETGRHYLMMGYSYLREILLELDRRHGLAGGIFFLRPEELQQLLRRKPLDALIRERRRDYNLTRSLTVPAVLFSDDLEAISRPAPSSVAVDWSGTPISPGEVEGEALIAHTPAEVPGDARPGFVLVCPFADAAWLPALVKASAVVLETGDPLAHVAVLLRELGLPAVANIPGILTALAPGRRIRVDGQCGTVSVADSEVAVKL
jgi:phosphohistidine swiveling domain-containing protein